MDGDPNDPVPLKVLGAELPDEVTTIAMHLRSGTMQQQQRFVRSVQRSLPTSSICEAHSSLVSGGRPCRGFAPRLSPNGEGPLPMPCQVNPFQSIGQAAPGLTDSGGSDRWRANFLAYAKDLVTSGAGRVCFPSKVWNKSSEGTLRRASTRNSTYLTVVCVMLFWPKTRFSTLSTLSLTTR